MNSVALAFWLSIVFFAVVAVAVLLWLSSQRTVNAATRKCPECGYSREGLIKDRCPECGLVLAQAIQRRRRSQRWRSVFVEWAGLIVLMAIIGVIVAIALFMSLFGWMM